MLGRDGKEKENARRNKLLLLLTIEMVTAVMIPATALAGRGGHLARTLSVVAPLWASLGDPVAWPRWLNLQDTEESLAPTDINPQLTEG